MCAYTIFGYSVCEREGDQMDEVYFKGHLSLRSRVLQSPSSSIVKYMASISQKWKEEKNNPSS